MKILKAIIEKGSDGLYSIYLPEVRGVYGTGETEAEAKLNLMEAVEAIKEHLRQERNWNDYQILQKEFSFDYRYDLSGFFKTYDFFDVSALAKKLGINASLLRRYKSGLSKAEVRQKEKIEHGIHHLADELKSVRF